jgi:hypothetical protein
MTTIKFIGPMVSIVVLLSVYACDRSTSETRRRSIENDSLNHDYLVQVTKDDSIRTYGYDAAYDSLVPKYKYSVLREVVNDEPGKTQVNTDILIPELEKSFDSLRLKNTMAYVFNIQKRKTGFTYKRHPNSLLLFCFANETSANRGSGEYISRMFKGPLDLDPKFELHRRYKDNLKYHPL